MVMMENVPLIHLSQRLEELFAANEFAAGFALGRHILRFYPRHLLTYREMGLAAFSIGLFADSMDLLQRALSADPQDLRRWEGLRDSALKLGLEPDARLATQYVQDIVSKEPPSTAIARGHVAATQGKWASAYGYFREGYAQHPERMDALLGMAEALFHLRQFQAQLTVAQYVIQELPYCLKAHLLCVLSQRMIGQQESQSARHTRVIRALDPTGVYSRQWFDAPILQSFFSDEALLSDWDATERWEYAPTV